MQLHDNRKKEERRKRIGEGIKEWGDKWISNRTDRMREGVNEKRTKREDGRKSEKQRGEEGR